MPEPEHDHRGYLCWCDPVVIYADDARPELGDIIIHHSLQEILNPQ